MTMSDPAAPAAQPAKPWTMNQRIAKWLPICAGVVVALVGAAKITDNFTLPSCDSSRSLGAIKSIFSDKNLAEPTLTNQRSVPGGSSEKFCQTAYEIPDEKGTLDYKVFWDGWEPKVMITKVSN
jgi:hypothetical protein